GGAAALAERVLAFRANERGGPARPRFTRTHGLAAAVEAGDDVLDVGLEHRDVAQRRYLGEPAYDVAGGDGGPPSTTAKRIAQRRNPKIELVMVAATVAWRYVAYRRKPAIAR